MNSRTDIINYFIKSRNYKTYLEIGVDNGENLMQIVCPDKIGGRSNICKVTCRCKKILCENDI